MKRRDRKGPQTVRRRPAPAAEGRLDGCGGLRDYGVGSEWKLPEQGGHHDALSFHRNGIVSSSAHHRSILSPVSRAAYPLDCNLSEEDATYLSNWISCFPFIDVLSPELIRCLFPLLSF